MGGVHGAGGGSLEGLVNYYIAETLGALLGAALVVGLAGSLTACGGGGGDPVSPEQAVVGTYTLRTVNGQPLPVPVTLNGDPWTITGGRVSLNADGTCSRFVAITGAGGDVSNTYPCTYSVAGSNITFYGTGGGGDGQMAVSGRTLTTFDSGLALVYRRG